MFGIYPIQKSIMGEQALQSLMEQQTLPVSAKKQSLKERLTNERNRLAERLKQLETALDALKKNPQIQEIIDIISRIY